MTPPRVERHIAAVLDRLRTGLPGVPVDVAVAPSSAPPPYVVIHPDPGMVARARLCGDSGHMLLRFDTEAIASGPEQALWLLDQVRILLLGDPLVVEGATVSRMIQTDTSWMRRDEVAQPPLYEVDAEFRATTQSTT